LYGGILGLRAFLYRIGVLPSSRLPVPVVCVGNLSMGGTGKTPLVMAVVRKLQKAGRRPAIVSRGYGGRAAEPVNVVSDGQNLLLDSFQAGDEPRLLAESLPGTPVLTGKKRVEVGRRAINQFGADTIVLDDGFQHLALQRDLDLVLVSAHSPLERSRVFPGGELRESFSALHRAQAVIVTGLDRHNKPRVYRFRDFLKKRFPQVQFFTGGYQPVSLSIDGKALCDLDEIEAMPLCGFCGIATPDSFRQSLATIGCDLRGFRVFRDHHAYTAADVAALIQWARMQGGHGLITTEKDYVKLEALDHEDFPIFVLRVELALSENLEKFLEKELKSW
jgi:tetraacyldisaccharide 4'-kinase